MARRASFIETTRPEDQASLIVDIGNFADRRGARGSSYKNSVLAAYYKALEYDAIGIGKNELGMGVDSLISFVEREQLPVICANLCDLKTHKPIFQPYLIKQDHNIRLGVVGLLSTALTTAMGSDTSHYEIRSAYTYAKRWIRKAAKKSDHLTVIGDFGNDEIDSLLNRYPEIDLLLTLSSPKGDRPIEHGNSLVLGAQQKGYYGNYIEWTLASPDTVLPYQAKKTTLDTRFPNDS
ncbi:hypothetical protein KKB28_01345, partial [bacterium]|nr:hypothetical protein [bacterium]